MKETGFICPVCGSPESTVRDSRPAGYGVRRRRRCPARHAYTTMEIIASESPVVMLPGSQNRPYRVVPLAPFLHGIKTAVIAKVAETFDRPPTPIHRDEP